MNELAEVQFARIYETLCDEIDGVAFGKMMSREAIMYEGQVFAFLREGEMIFKLGREFQPEQHGIMQYSVLAPFKHKAPMYDWLQIPAEAQDQWENLARLALRRMQDH